MLDSNVPGYKYTDNFENDNFGKNLKHARKELGLEIVVVINLGSSSTKSPDMSRFYCARTNTGYFLSDVELTEI